MTERELERQHQERETTADDAHVAPGRANTSAGLTRSAQPRASGLLMRKASNANGVTDDASDAVDAAATSSAHGLPDDLRSRFETSLGTDLSGVRIHTGAESARAAESVNAHAFALGNDIHFAEGAYNPSSNAGAELLAHEVAHTVQQRGSAPVQQFKLAVSSAGDASEVEADAAATAMIAGSPFQLSTAGGGIQRKELGEDKDTGAKETDTSKDKKTDKEKMLAIEERMTGVTASAQGVGAAVLANSDACIAALKGACNHLKTSVANYSAAYSKVKAKLAEAQKAYELEQAVTAAVKDLILGSTIGLLPGINSSFVLAMTAVKNEKGEIVSSLGSIGAAIATNAASVGTGAAQKATAEGEKEVAPKDSISGAGLTPGDKVTDAFNQLTDMVGAVPSLGALGGAIKDIAISAANIGKEAVKASSGAKAKWSIAEIESKADAIERLEVLHRSAESSSSKTRQKLQGTASGITNVPILDVDTVENKLWTNWMASRGTRTEKELINIDVIEDYLVERGLMKSPGSYMDDQEEDDAVIEAQKRVLKDHQIDAPSDPAKVTSLYRREMKCDELKRALIGQTGVIESANRVKVAGGSYRAPGNMGGAEIGGEVKVMWVVPTEGRQSHDLTIVEWTANDFDLLGSKA